LVLAARLAIRPRTADKARPFPELRRRTNTSSDTPKLVVVADDPPKTIEQPSDDRVVRRDGGDFEAVRKPASPPHRRQRGEPERGCRCPVVWPRRPERRTANLRCRIVRPAMKTSRRAPHGATSGPHLQRRGEGVGDSHAREDGATRASGQSSGSGQEPQVALRGLQALVQQANRQLSSTVL